MGWIGFKAKEETPEGVSGLSACWGLCSGMGSSVRNVSQGHSPAVHLGAAIAEC